ncbi:MAG TPA: RDD family protein [Bryobacteraceae bacterium]
MPGPLPGGAAPALDALPGGARHLPSRQPNSNPESPSHLQPPLFRYAPIAPKVVPIPTLTPRRPVERESAPKAPPRVGSSRTRRLSDLQQPFEFPDSRAVAGAPAEAIDCDAPVALPIHRLMAAAVDFSAVLIALGLFGGILYACGGDFSLTRQSMTIYAGVAFLTAMFYRVLWCLGNGDSPGMRFAGLHLVDFDGRNPTRQRRLLRQLVSLLSLLSAGLGLIWALVDEENLTWHDRISETFPTPGM